MELVSVVSYRITLVKIVSSNLSTSKEIGSYQCSFLAFNLLKLIICIIMGSYVYWFKMDYIYVRRFGLILYTYVPYHTSKQTDQRRKAWSRHQHRSKGSEKWYLQTITDASSSSVQLPKPSFIESVSHVCSAKTDGTYLFLWSSQFWGLHLLN